MRFVPYLPDPGEEYHDNVDDAAEALRARLDPTSRKMLTHLLTLVSYERGRTGETIRCMARDIEKLQRPHGIVPNPDTRLGHVWWTGQRFQYRSDKRVPS